MGSGTTVLNGANSYNGGTTIGAGTLQVVVGTQAGTNDSSIGTGPVMLDGGIFQAGAAGLSFANAFVIDATTGTIDTQANTLTLSGGISDGTGSTGGLTKIGSRHARSVGHFELYGSDQRQRGHAAGGRRECVCAAEPVQRGVGRRARP